MKQSNDGGLAKSVINALEATDQIFFLKHDRDEVVRGNKKHNNNKETKQAKIRSSECECKDNDGTHKAIGAIVQELQKKEKQSTKGSNAIDTLIEAMQKLTLQNNESSDNRAISEEQTEKLLSQLIRNKDKKGKSMDQVVKSLVNFEDSTDSSGRQTEEETDEARGSKKGRLTPVGSALNLMNLISKKWSNLHMKNWILAMQRIELLINSLLTCWLRERSC